jgi:hypothetical protein
MGYTFTHSLLWCVKPLQQAIEAGRKTNVRVGERFNGVLGEVVKGKAAGVARRRRKSENGGVLRNDVEISCIGGKKRNRTRRTREMR